MPIAYAARLLAASSLPALSGDEEPGDTDKCTAETEGQTSARGTPPQVLLQVAGMSAAVVSNSKGQDATGPDSKGRDGGEVEEGRQGGERGEGGEGGEETEAVAAGAREAGGSAEAWRDKFQAMGAEQLLELLESAADLNSQRIGASMGSSLSSPRTLSPCTLSLSEGVSGSDGTPPPVAPELQVAGGNVTVSR